MNHLLYVILAVVIIESAIIIYFTAYSSLQFHKIRLDLSNLSSQISGIRSGITNFNTSIQNSSLSNISYFSPNAPFGHRLTNISKQINSTQLSIMNNAPNSYFEKAGEMLLNSKLNNQIFMQPVTNSSTFPAFLYNGKPSVIYIGAISCIFCGEGRWSMALALSRFGKFSNLYTGYSSIGDKDVPSLYWINDNYTIPSGIGYGNSYNSQYINFISADYESPIIQGFQIRPLNFFVQEAPNSTYKKAMSFMNSTNQFQGTPFTFWGNTLLKGVDGVIFGNSTPSGIKLPLTYETHSEVFTQIKTFNDQFAWSEYAAADIYGAYVCSTLTSLNKTKPAFCSLPAVKKIGARMNLS